MTGIWLYLAGIAIAGFIIIKFVPNKKASQN